MTEQFEEAIKKARDEAYEKYIGHLTSEFEKYRKTADTIEYFIEKVISHYDYVTEKFDLSGMIDFFGSPYKPSSIKFAQCDTPGHENRMLIMMGYSKEGINHTPDIFKEDYNSRIVNELLKENNIEVNFINDFETFRLTISFNASIILENISQMKEDARAKALQRFYNTTRR